MNLEQPMPSDSSSSEQEELVYKNLKEDLLNGHISLEEVRDKLIELDQKTNSRDASEMNLSFLRDPEVVQFLSKDPEAIAGYNRVLSFTEFHVAQRLALNNDQGSLSHFQESLDSAQQDKSNQSWCAYVKGTFLYVQGKEIPEDLISQCEQTRNAEILRNLNKGLKERERPLYKEDYFK